jgi:hypothetical protein
VIPREYRSTTNDVDMLIEIHGLRTKERNISSVFKTTISKSTLNNLARVLGIHSYFITLVAIPLSASRESGKTILNVRSFRVPKSLERDKQRATWQARLDPCLCVSRLKRFCTQAEGRHHYLR